MAEPRKTQKQERKRGQSPASAGAVAGMQAMAKMMNSKVSSSCQRSRSNSKSK